MRNGWLGWLLVIVFCGVCSASESAAMQSSNADQYAGTWSGTWDGSGAGQFDLTLEKGKDGAYTGRVAVTTDGGNYTADLKAVSFEGKKMTAKYDFPLDGTSEVAMSATFEASAARGTWSLHAKGENTELAGGTFTLGKK